MTPKQKIPVGILGATGSVGQKCIALLAEHPWFSIAALAASSGSAGKRYGEVTRWMQAVPLPERIAAMPILPCTPDLPCRLVFSGLDSAVAGDIETAFATAGYVVVSNASAHRQDAHVPLLIPEVNSDHLAQLRHQHYPHGGLLVTNPNCSTVGLVMALKPLHDAFGLEAVHVVTMQAISGAGYPGVASMDILDNVIPYIGSEEEKVEREPRKIFGTVRDGVVTELPLAISAHCNRVPVVDGHVECISVRLGAKPSAADVLAAWQSFRAQPQELALPLAPVRPVHYLAGERFPQPKLQRDLERGMAVSVGRLRPDPLFDYKFVALVHNTIRGAAGGAILNAELMVRQGLIT